MPEVPFVKEVLSDNNNSRIEGLITSVKNKIKENPQDYTNYEMLALLYDRFGLFDKAAETIKLALKYYPPGSASIHVLYANLSRAYINLGKIEDAKIAIDTAIQLCPGNIKNHMQLLICYLLNKKYDEGALELKAIQTMEKEGKDWYEEAYLYSLTVVKDHDEMVLFFKKAVEFDPESYFAHRILAIAIRNSANDNPGTKMEFVMQEFYKALELNPEYTPAYISIAETYWLLGIKARNNSFFEKSLQWLNKAYAFDSGNMKLIYAIGNIYIYLGRYDEAISKIEYAYGHGLRHQFVVDNLVFAYNKKAYAMYQSDDSLEEGLIIIDKAIALKPDDGILLSTKAELLYKMEKFSEAYDYINKALVLEPNDAEIKKDKENIKKAMEQEKKRSKKKKNKKT